MATQASIRVKSLDEEDESRKLKKHSAQHNYRIDTEDVHVWSSAGIHSTNINKFSNKAALNVWSPPKTQDESSLFNNWVTGNVAVQDVVGQIEIQKPSEPYIISSFLTYGIITSFLDTIGSDATIAESSNIAEIKNWILQKQDLENRIQNLESVVTDLQNDIGIHKSAQEYTNNVLVKADAKIKTLAKEGYLIKGAVKLKDGEENIPLLSGIDPEILEQVLSE